MLGLDVHSTRMILRRKTYQRLPVGLLGPLWEYSGCANCQVEVDAVPWILLVSDFPPIKLSSLQEMGLICDRQEYQGFKLLLPFVEY